MKVHPAATTLKVHRHIATPRQEAEEKKPLPAPTKLSKEERARPKTLAAEITPAPRIPEEEHDKDKTRGVIRLLEEGHFRGVADVRLRINFFDELAARAGERADVVAEEDANDLLESINIHVGHLLETLPINEDVQDKVDALLGEFDASVNTVIDRFGSDTSQEELTKQLQSAFDLLVTQLRDLLAPKFDTPDLTVEEKPEGDTPEEEGTILNVPGEAEALAGEDATEVAIEGIANSNDDAPDSGGAPPEAGAVDPFQGVLDAFSQALATLLVSITSAVQLPDPSPPNGNGVAYGKFLAMYNELRGIDPTIEETG